LARALPAQAPPLVLYLHGDLGAGKTTLARGVLRELGESGPVRSPTYSLVAEYEPAGQRVLHLDLYRLNSPDELQALGLADYLHGSRLWLVEWPERGEGGGLPPADASLYLEPDGGGRRVQLIPASAAGRAWVAALQTDSGS
jgi:tRNA threonylcarbamoyladenosine biosynthesis protein TsaE